MQTMKTKGQRQRNSNPWRPTVLAMTTFALLATFGIACSGSFLSQKEPANVVIVDGEDLCEQAEDGEFAGRWICGRLWMAEHLRLLDEMSRELEYWVGACGRGQER